MKTRFEIFTEPGIIEIGDSCVVAQIPPKYESVQYTDSDCESGFRRLGSEVVHILTDQGFNSTMEIEIFDSQSPTIIVPSDAAKINEFEIDCPSRRLMILVGCDLEGRVFSVSSESVCVRVFHCNLATAGTLIGQIRERYEIYVWPKLS